MRRGFKIKQGLVLTHPSAGPLTTKDYLKIGLFAGIFTVYTGILLWTTDHVLAKVLPDYNFSGRYEIGLAFFFVFAIIFTLFGRWRGWLNWRFYVFGSLAIFFPLVFLASSVSILIAPENVLVETNKELYCRASSQETLCGEALAAVIFSMSLRALPTVLTLPPIYWYFSVHLPTQRNASPNE